MSKNILKNQDSKKVEKKEEISEILPGNDKKIEELTEENRRLNYRITHLVNGMKEILENKVK